MNQEEQTELYSRMHAEWLQQPITRLILSAIDKHTANHTNLLQRDALNHNVPDATIRGIVISLQNTAAIKTLITNFEAMNKQVTKEKE